jgi:O-glycosyl hydrolase
VFPPGNDRQTGRREGRAPSQNGTHAVGVTAELPGSLRQALQVNSGLQILANPWSPPGWMKANDALDNINDQGTLLPSANGPLADYFVKFIQAYETLAYRSMRSRPRTSRE